MTEKQPKAAPAGATGAGTGTPPPAPTTEPLTAETKGRTASGKAKPKPSPMRRWSVPLALCGVLVLVGLVQAGMAWWLAAAVVGALCIPAVVGLIAATKRRQRKAARSLDGTSAEGRTGRRGVFGRGKPGTGATPGTARGAAGMGSGAAGRGRNSMGRSGGAASGRGPGGAGVGGESGKRRGPLGRFGRKGGRGVQAAPGSSGAAGSAAMPGSRGGRSGKPGAASGASQGRAGLLGKVMPGRGKRAGATSGSAAGAAGASGRRSSGRAATGPSASGSAGRGTGTAGSAGSGSAGRAGRFGRFSRKSGGRSAGPGSATKAGPGMGPGSGPKAGAAGPGGKTRGPNTAPGERKAGKAKRGPTVIDGETVAGAEQERPGRWRRFAQKSGAASGWVGVKTASAAGHTWRAAKTDAEAAGRVGTYAATTFGERARTWFKRDRTGTAAGAHEAEFVPPRRSSTPTFDNTVYIPAGTVPAGGLPPSPAPKAAPQAAPAPERRGPFVMGGHAPARSASSHDHFEPNYERTQPKENVMTEHHPAVSAASESMAQLGGHQFRNYRDIRGMVHATPQMLANLASAYEVIGQQMANTPAGTQTAQDYMTLASQLRSASQSAETSSAMFSATHVDDDRRLDAPRPNEAMADYSRNLD